MKKLLLVIAVFCALKVNAQDYLITFAAAGATTSLATVKVENLMAGTSLTLNGSDILHLTVLTGVNSIESVQSSEMKIYPNPMTGNSILQISPPLAGEAIISVMELTGKLVFKIPAYLEDYTQEFRLSGLKSGLYLVNVKGSNYQYSGKLLSNSKEDGTIKIEKVSNNKAVKAVDEKKIKTDSKGVQATVDMNYTTGDRLKFTGKFEKYSTVKMDIPASSKTITFNFIPCRDESNNLYSIVEIGTQVWMAENLKTTKYNDNTDIPLVTDAMEWGNLSTPGYCWYNNDDAANKNTYGALYNWYTVNIGKLCPTGWHVPTDAQWTTFTDYLTNNGYGYGGSGSNIAKSMAATSGWTTSTTAGTVGNDQASNNSSGFSALPGGSRSSYNGAFVDVGNTGLWWSSTETLATYAYFRYMIYHNTVILGNYGDKTSGLYVRCLKDY